VVVFYKAAKSMNSKERAGHVSSRWTKKEWINPFAEKENVVSRYTSFDLLYAQEMACFTFSIDRSKVNFHDLM
jgi:hypothetical protein